MTSMAAIAATRRLKWHYQQFPQTPRILHLPRRPSRRKVPKSHLKKPTSGLEKKGKLEALFDQEREFSRESVPVVVLDYGGEGGRRRERVEVEESCNDGGTAVEAAEAAEEEEKWKFQAELLRAECNLLRMEREIAVKKFERSKDQTEGVLKSAIELLSSGRKQICEGKNEKMILEEAISVLREKLEKLRKSSVATNAEAQNPSNFDKHSNLLKKRLEKIGKADETQELTTMKPIHCPDWTSEPNCKDKLTVDILKSKMEGLSNGTLLERMKEECGSMLSTASSSLASSASNSKRIESFDCSFSKQKQHQDKTSNDENICSRRCKAIIRTIIEQVGAETEQWSQMQEMLSQVKEEMEGLQTSRVFWEDQAIRSNVQIQSLCSEVEKWREKATSSGSKVDELEGQISVLSQEVHRLRIDKKNKPRTRIESKDCSLPSNETQNEIEKRVLVCRTRACYNDGRKLDVFKDNGIASRRSPLEDIGNISIPVRRDMKLIPCSSYRS